MDNRIEFDAFLKRVCAENPEAAAALGPDFAKLQNQAADTWRRRRAARRRSAALKAAAVFFVTVVLANGVLLFSQTTAANAYKVAVKKLYFQLTGQSEKGSEAMRKTVDDDLNHIQGIVPFKVITPGWLPEGFTMDQAKFVETGLSDYNVKIWYRNGDRVLIVSQSNNLSALATAPSDEEAAVERVIIKDIEAFIMETEMEGIEHSTICNYITRHGLMMTVGGDIDKENLIHVVQSLIEQE